MQVASVRRRFLEYNRRFFGSRLPSSTRIRLTARTTRQGVTCCGEVLLDIDARFTITLDSTQNERNIRMALLHEMAHLSCITRWKCWDEGARFQSEMLRLATAGAFRLTW